MTRRGQGIDPIPIQAPTPSILTTARPRTSDDFGVRVPVPDEVDVPDGALDPAKTSWRTGVSWVQSVCAPSSNQGFCPSADDTEMGDMPEGGWGLVTSMPFWQFTPIECEWAVDDSEVQAAAEALTDARAAWGLGRALWLGEGLPADLDQPTLRNSATIAPGGDAATPIEEAVALLLAAYELGTQGLGGQTLHIPGPLMVSALGGGDGGIICRPEGNFYRGPNGSVVSPGPGYPFGPSDDDADGFGPYNLAASPGFYEGNSADETWIYITGPVEYALSKVMPLMPTGGLRRQNRHKAWAMSQLIFRFDPCTAYAALVESPVPFAEVS
jgi:hypothetical protein